MDRCPFSSLFISLTEKTINSSKMQKKGVIASDATHIQEDKGRSQGRGQGVVAVYWRKTQRKT